MLYTRKKIILVALLSLFLVLSSLLAWHLWPVSSAVMKQSSLTISRASWYEVDVDGKPLLYFRNAVGDSLLQGITSCRDSAIHHHRMTGCWVNRWAAFPSCKGRVMCIDNNEPRKFNTPNKDSLMHLLRKSLDRELHILGYQKSELDYYLRVHGVQDNGYQYIAALAAKVDKAYGEASCALYLVDSLSQSRFGRLTVNLRSDYTAYYLADGKMHSAPLDMQCFDPASHLLLLHLPSDTTPEDVSSVVMLPWHATMPSNALCVGFGGVGEPDLAVNPTSPSLMPAHVSRDGKHDMPRVLAGDGSPVYTTRGIFVGLVSGDTIVPRQTMCRLFK